jgi:hypothetical protein
MPKHGMNGQWIGEYKGTTSGTVIVNIDDRQSHYQGVAYLLESDKTLPSAAAFFRTHDKNREFEFRTDVILAIDPNSGNPVLWEGLKNRYRESLTFSRYADVKGCEREDSLSLSWTTDTMVVGECILPRSKAGEASEIPATEHS